MNKTTTVILFFVCVVVIAVIFTNNFKELQFSTQLEDAQKGRVKIDDPLYRLAQEKTDAMVDGSSPFDHNEEDLRQRINQLNTYDATRSEILYRGSCDLSVATENWDKSPTHAEILHDTDYKRMVCYMIRASVVEDRCYITCEYEK